MSDELLVSFPDQSASFVHGFEAGEIWQQMKDDNLEKIERLSHFENREVITRMALNCGFSASFLPMTTEGWDTAELTRIKAEPIKPNPHGLRLVKPEGA